MNPIAIRRAVWTAVLVVVALAAFLLWLISAEKRGDWLREAAWTNDLVRAKLLVWLGTDVNSSKGGSTALHGAAYHGNIEMMTFLIQRGAAIDQSGKFGVTALWQARHNKQSAAEQLLIAHGANPDTSHIDPP